jgi:uncharacterized protein YajQ (UPF0234 family)
MTNRFTISKEYIERREIGKAIEALIRILDSDYDFKKPMLYVRKKGNLVIMAESEFNRLKKIENEKSE